MRFLFILLYLFSLPVFSNEVLTRVIDTGAGHASITKMPNGQIMVFDAGRSSSSDHIVQQMKDVMGNNDVIYLLVLSHTDSDHLGAVPAIFNNFTVKYVLRTGLYRCTIEDDCDWRKSQNAIRKAVNKGNMIDLNLKIYPIGHGYTFHFGDASVQFLSGYHTPPESWGLRVGSSDWKNAGSIVMRLDYDGKSILFTGDEWGKKPGAHDVNGDQGINESSLGAEKYLIKHHNERSIKSDVYIAAHHGADDANSFDFLEIVEPQFVILPAGGSHQHPRYRTVKRIQHATGLTDDKFFRTDLCDTPGIKEWPIPWEQGADDSKNDDDIDIRLIKGNDIPSITYVTSSGDC